MIYIEIPYIVENNRVARNSIRDEIQILKVGDNLKAEIFEAIYHPSPRGVYFENEDAEQVLLLEKALHKLGIPYRQVKD